MTSKYNNNVMDGHSNINNNVIIIHANNNNYVRDAIEPIPDAFFNPLYEKLKMYYITGGMPESVLMWTEARDVSAMQEALSNIIGAYERDFAKHPDIKEFPKISMIWKSIPSQLARENKKYYTI